MNSIPVQTITFGGDGNARHFQMFGWSAGETGFTWSVGTQCELALPALDAPDGFLIELTCGVFRPIDLEVQVNGTTIAACVIDAPGSFVWQAPPTEGPVPIRLTFNQPNARRPSEVSDSTDGRQLGLQFRGLRLLRLEPSASAVPDDVPPDAELAMAFASLGDDSEFNFVQRGVGVECAGLLHFAESALPLVQRGIESGWDGLGDQLDVAVEAGEWITRDYQYGLRQHSFHRPDEIDHDTLLVREREKIALLRRQLNEQVANAGRVFVVKSNYEGTSANQIIAMHVALNRFAPNWLLWVTPGGEPGSVELIAPRLMRGHVSRFMRPKIPHDYVLADWMAVLRQAWRIARGIVRQDQPIPAFARDDLPKMPDTNGKTASLAVDSPTSSVETETSSEYDEDDLDIDARTFPTLESIERIYQDKPSVHRLIYNACETAMTEDAMILRHREYVERNKLGFGDRAFHWLWKLLVDSMPAHFKFLEIGVYKGQVTSLVGMLAMAANKTAETLGITPLGAFGDKFSSYETGDYLTEIRSIEAWSGIPEEKRARIIRGFSDDDGVKQECRTFAPFDIIYIDGCHDYDAVANDIITYGELLKPNGLLVMDDAATELRLPKEIWPGHPDVGRAIRDVLEPSRAFKRIASVGHLRVWRKSGLSEGRASPGVIRINQSILSAQPGESPASSDLTGSIIEAELSFATASYDPAGLVSGWGNAEGDVRWSVDYISRFAMRIAHDADFFILELESRACARRPGSPAAHRLNVRVNGQRAGETLMTDAGTVAFRFQNRARAGDLLEFTLEFPDAMRPSDDGTSHEQRLLAIAMSRARLFSIPPPVQFSPRASFMTLPSRASFEVLSAEVMRLSGLGAADLVAGFEGIGHDCEFGLFQRVCGAEPISLLRFAAIDTRDLIRGLDADFEGIDDPASISAVLYTPDGDFHIHHEKYNFRYHTFSYAKDTTAEAVEARHARLLTLGRRFLFERLANAERIFVFKRNRQVGDAEALALLRALARHGPATLLYVVLADAAHPAGYVELVMPGLMKGYIDTFWFEGMERASARQWLEICLNAHALAP